MYKIEKGVEIPVIRGATRIIKYPFSEMDVNDSFIVPCSANDSLRVRSDLYNHAYAFKNSSTEFRGRKFTMRIIHNEGVRVWRIK